MATACKVAAAIQQVLGGDLEELGKSTGVIQRLRKFSATRLLRMIVLTLFAKPNAKPDDFRATASQMGVNVSETAIKKRFSPKLVEFLRRALMRAAQKAMAVAPSAPSLLNKFSAVFVGDSTSFTLPDELADEFPGCGGKSKSGRAALKIQVLWELIMGAIVYFELEPGRRSDAKSSIAQVSAPPRSLTVFDLGYFSLERFRSLSDNKAYWISRLQHGVKVFDCNGQPLSLLELLRGHRGSQPLDVRVLLGEKERLPVRLIAIRVPQEVADGRRRAAHQKAQKDGRTASREYLQLQDWTIFVTNCEPEQLTWKEVVVLYRARWQIELLFKLWKSHNRIAALKAGLSAVEQMAIIYGKLISVILQHWILLSATWSNARRSLQRAAKHLTDWVKQIVEALDDIEELIRVLGRIEDTLGNVATVANRKRRPSHAQLMMDPELLDWAP